MKTALALITAALLSGCMLDEGPTPTASTTIVRRHRVEYVPDQPYYNVYYDYGSRPYYRRHYYEDEPTYRVEARRYYSPGSRVVVRQF
jgi:hypothetical protein